MARPSNQSINWDFTVAQLPLHGPNGKVIPNLFGNFREDTGECLGTTSEQYGLAQNKELMETAIAALASKGLTDYKQRTIVGGGGRKFFSEFTFANKQLANAVGDLFGFKLILKNSFDRTLRAAFSLGFLRLTCLNGAATLEKEFGVTRKHSTKVTVDFIAGAIDSAMEKGQSALSVYDDLAKIAISDEQGLNILKNLEASKALSAVLRSPIETLWLAPRRAEDKARTLYNLYNAVTEHLTHQVEGDRYEYANGVNSDILFRFVNAARKPENLAKLIVPVAKDVKVTLDMGTGPIIDVESAPA